MGLLLMQSILFISAFSETIEENGEISLLLRESEFPLTLSLNNNGTSTNSTSTGSCKDVYPFHCPTWGHPEGLNYCNSTTWGSWMGQNCRKTCNQCENCADTHKSCESWARSGYCTMPSTFATISSRCPVSCRMCQSSSQSTCVDGYTAANQCSYWAGTLGLCSKPFLRYNCRSSCLYCNDCSDFHPEAVCRHFLDEGLCNSNVTEVKSSMEAYCRKTCGFCGNQESNGTVSAYFV